MKKLCFALIIALIVAVGCQSTAQMPKTANAEQQKDILAAHIDPSVNPGDDFFAYASGEWLKQNPIPASESNWGISSLIREELYIQLRSINESAAQKKASTGTDEQKIGDFWATAMNEAKANELGLKPIKSELDRIDAIKTPQDAANVAFALQRIGVDAFFSFSVAQDEKKSDEMAVHLQQGGLGLPERDFYFNNEAGVAKIRTEYVAHLQNMLKLSGSKDAAASAANILAFETEMAKVSRKLEDLRDPQSNYNKMSLTDIQRQYTPSIAWKDRLHDWNLQPDTVIVGQPEFFNGLEALLNKTPVAVLRDYLRFHLVSNYAPYLNSEIENENFNFYNRILSGQKEPRPRWKRVLDSQDGPIGMVLGRIFVKEYFPESSKKRYSDLVESMRNAYNERINRLDWMSDATKVKAHQKLAAVTKKVGYPDKWKDYSGLVIGQSSYCENMMNVARWSFDDDLAKYGKPVDRTEWSMTPQTYNAYYNSSNNEIVLPAAIFEIPGMKDADVDDALAYGYAGAGTIGHEITHGFDDEGRQYDYLGNLVEWWTAEDAAQFQKRANFMVKQFDGYQPLPGIHINGRASLGENIADYGGLLIGLDAFKKTEQYKKGEKIGGLTPIQRYFLGYALGWLSQMREEVLRRNLLSDVHSPAKWRVLGPLSNIPEFHQAFGIKQGQPMWIPEESRVHIW